MSPSKRMTFHVNPGIKGWDVSGGPEESFHPTKEEAVQQAKEWAENEHCSNVVVHKVDGSVESEYTFSEIPVGR